jgi:hypothetical protein
MFGVKTPLRSDRGLLVSGKADCCGTVRARHDWLSIDVSDRIYLGGLLERGTELEG